MEVIMKSFKYTIQDPLGLHTRPAGVLVKKAKEYESTITIIKGEKEAQATRLMAVMALAVKTGDEVTVKVEGSDENSVCTEVEQFFKENF
jgi:phosphocarrier protein